MEINNVLDKQYMQLALKEAQKAYTHNEVPVGAVVVCEGVVVGSAHNQVETLQDATAHAELRALQMACKSLGSKYLTNCTLYVTLEPCAMCAMACYWTQIHQVVWGTKDEKRGFELFSPHLLHPKTQITQGIYATESQELLQRFFQQLRTQKKHGLPQRKV